MNKLSQGDYVLATKWNDGDPQDHWCVGFYHGMTGHESPRYDVVDTDGNLFRGNGFRRAEKITQREGLYLLNAREKIQWSGISLWSWLKTAKSVISDVEQARKTNLGA